MKSGDVFTVDAQAIEETAAFTKVALEALQAKVNVGDTFSISKADKCTTSVIRGTRWVDGKPQKGRPRRFPRATVARLLGEDDSAFESTQGAQEAQEAASQAAAEAALVEHATTLLNEPAPVAAEVSDEDSSW
jgi:hypothetical protein